MISGQKVLGVIPARGGSKGVPGKNLRMVQGKPLVAWTILAAQGSHFLDRVILSSDDDAIINTAREWGCETPFVRPTELATDEATTVDVVLDALNRCPGFDWVVVLQPTSPLRVAADIDGALERCFELDAPACVSVCQTDQSPYWMFSIDKGYLHRVLDVPEITRRQDLPTSYVLNGAVYVSKTAELLRTRSFTPASVVAYEMPTSRSLDIDTEQDLKYFDFLTS